MEFTINIFYKNQMTSLKLTTNKTVEDIKIHIFNQFGIYPSKQILTNWNHDPIYDNSEITSFLYFEENTIFVTSTEDHELSQNVDVTDDDVMLSNLNFIASFLDEYNYSHVTFPTCNLEEAIQTACFVPLEMRKVIALFLNNPTDPFSKMLCPNLRGGAITDVLEESFFFLGCDISQEKYHRALKKAITENIDNDLITGIISKKIAALVIIYPIQDSVTVYSVLFGEKVRDECLLTALTEISKNFKEEIKNELFLNNLNMKCDTSHLIGSQELQQLMYERLGDRDYDCFEYDEHDHLKKKIGYAIFGPPNNTSLKEYNSSWYGSKETKVINKVYTQIRKYNNLYSEWENQIIVSFIYTCLEPTPSEKVAKAKKNSEYNGYTDVCPVPIFVLRKCQGTANPCRIFIDNDNRVYNSWREYINDNKLHKCNMILPKYGRYKGDENDCVLLEKHLSPSCGIGHKILTYGDVGSAALGIGSGSVFIAASVPAITVAPIALAVAGVVGVGVGIYSIARSGVNLYDRYSHGQSMNLSDSESRTAYLNIIAGTLGFVGAGATTAVSQFASNGYSIGQGTKVVINGVGIANISVSGLGVANSVYQVAHDYYENKEAPSAFCWIQLGSSILFFGHSIYNFQSVNVTIDEAQNDTLKTMSESLRSNRHRKVLDKMTKETIRQAGGEVQQGKAEVIATIRNMSNNQDELFAILKRSNKLFNKKGVKFSASEKGDILLNGEKINIMRFDTMNNIQKQQVINDLPPIPQINKNNTSAIATVKKTINECFYTNNSNITEYGGIIINCASFIKTANCLLFNFSEVSKTVIIKLTKLLIDKLMKICNIELLSKCFPSVGKDTFSIILELILGYLTERAKKLYNDYIEAKQEAQLSDDFDEIKFNSQYRIAPNLPVTMTWWIEKFLKVSIMPEGRFVEEVVEEIQQYILSFIAQKAIDQQIEEERQISREKNTKKRTQKIDCQICGGYYFK